MEALPPFIAEEPALRADVLRAARAIGATAAGTVEEGGPASAAGDATAALAALLRTLARQRPSVLFIDDWHWVDDATRRVVAAVRDESALPLMVLIAARELSEPDAVGRAAEIIELTPLEPPEAMAAIGALRPDADPRQMREIQALSGSNPLFIEELCHVPAREWASYAATRASEGLAWLHTLIESRVERLPPAAADLVRMAAIIGNVVPLWLLERLSGREDCAALTQTAAEHDLLFPGERTGTLRFKHGITRDVIYNAIGLGERRVAHLRIAGLIEEREETPDDVTETLAYHFHGAGQWSETARYAALAGEKAMKALALDRARTHYATALEALAAQPASDTTYEASIRILQRFGLACVYDPARAQLAFFHRAVEMASTRNDDVSLARAEYWLAYITYALGDVRTAIERCARARQRCEQALGAAEGTLAAELRALQVQVLAILGQAHSAACEHARADVELHDVVEARRRHKAGRRLSAGSAYTLACRGASLGDLGRFDEAYACFDDALAAVGDGDHAVKGSVLNWQAGVYMWQGRWEEALTTSHLASTVAERIESLYVWGMAQSINAYATWMLTGRAESIDTIRRTASWLEMRDKRLVISILYGWLADAFADLGRIPEARRYAGRALHRLRAYDRFGEAMALRALARLPAAHRTREPDDYLRRAMRAAERRASPHEIAVTLMAQAQAHIATGNSAGAAALLHRARSAFDGMGMAWHGARSEALLRSVP